MQANTDDLSVKTIIAQSVWSYPEWEDDLLFDASVPNDAALDEMFSRRVREASNHRPQHNRSRSEAQPTAQTTPSQVRKAPVRPRRMRPYVNANLLGSYATGGRVIPDSIKVPMQAVRRFRRDDALGLAPDADAMCRCGHHGFAHSSQHGCGGNHGSLDEWTPLTYAGHNECSCAGFVASGTDRSDSSSDSAPTDYPPVVSTPQEHSPEIAVAAPRARSISAARGQAGLGALPRRFFTAEEFRMSIVGLRPHELTLQQRVDQLRWNRQPKKQAAMQRMLATMDIQEQEREAAVALRAKVRPRRRRLRLRLVEV